MEKINTQNLFPEQTDASSYRDELIIRLVKGMDASRVKAGFKPKYFNKRWKERFAIEINKNPMLAKSNWELEQFIKKCEEKGYWYFWKIVYNKD